MSKNVLQKDALDFLRASTVAVIATCNENKPHSSSIYYDVDSEFNFYYMTKRNTRKNIQTAFNPNVALVVGTGPEKISVQAEGVAEMLVENEKIDAIHRMIARFSAMGIEDLPLQNMEMLKANPVVVYKIVPTSLTFMNMDSKRFPSSVSKYYHQII